MRYLAIFVVTASLTLLGESAAGVELPWKTFEEMLQGNIVGKAGGFCHEKEPVLTSTTVVRYGGVEFTLMLAKTVGVFAIAYDPKPDMPVMPTEFARGVFTSLSEPIPPLIWQPLSSTNVCSVLFPPMAVLMGLAGKVG